MKLYNLIIFVALLFEFIGVWMITKGFVNITISDIKESTKTVINSNPKMAKSLVGQKLDGQFGGIFLLIGIAVMFLTLLIESNQLATITNIGCSFCFSLIIFSSLFGYKNNRKVELYDQFNYTSDELGDNNDFEESLDKAK